MPIRCWSIILFLCTASSLLGQPTLGIDRSAGAPRLKIGGTSGDYLVLQSTTNLMATNGWTTLLSFPLTNSAQQWFDSTPSPTDHRFYRAIKLSSPPARQLAPDFRLMDHLGISRELFYYSNQKAVVLVFTVNNCPTVDQFIATIKSLRDQYSPSNVVFWMVDPNPQDSRSNLAAQAASQAIDLPILQDDSQVIAKAFGVTVAPSVVCLNARDWTVFYRGALDDRWDPSASARVQHYLVGALDNFLAGKTVSPEQTAAIGCPISYPVLAPVSYATQIAPLLQNHCVRCHSPGNIAPWAMTNHAIVAAHLDSIKSQVMTSRMPPWHADPQFGLFANDVSLSPTEISTLLQWIDEGGTRGSGPDILINVPPVPPTWPLGTPSRIINIPLQSLPASGDLAYRYLTVSTGISSNVWLRAAVVQPGNSRVVHHALVFVGTSFLDVFLGTNAGGLNGYFAGYVPGAEATEFPSGTGKFLPANSSLTFQMHYITTGTIQTDQTQLGLYFATNPPSAELLTRAASTTEITLLPGVADYERTAEFTPSASQDVLVYEMSPHMHYRGSRFRYDAVYPNGTLETLLSVPKYDFHWQSMYRFVQPKRLPAGTIIRVRGAFDNSAQNWDNPDPTQTVSFGDQTHDEMFIGYVNFSVVP